MPIEVEAKTKPADPLLVLVAALLLVALGATLYFSAAGPSKSYQTEPPIRPKVEIKDETRVVLVTREVSGPAAREAATTTPTPKVEPAKAEAAAPVEKVAVAAAPVVKSIPDGKVRGHVILVGAPPAERSIGAAKADPNCGKSYPESAPTTRSYVVGPGGGLRYALVRIVEAPAGAVATAPAAPVLFDQKGCMYEPYVAAVQAGTPFKVRNSDAFLHNVASSPKLNKGFNFTQGVAGQENEKVFDKPEIFVKLQCNVHPWMIAYLAVLDNPFYAVTDESGSFSLPEGLPPGKYTLEAQHLKSGAAKAQIEIGPGKGADVSFQMAVK